MAKGLNLNKGKNLKLIMNISGFQKFSLIDYPGKISAVIFTQGCNFRCPYCHNPELWKFKKGLINEKEVLGFLETRKNQLEAVVITGGEPTLQIDLVDFLKKIKKIGFLIKLDTNGSNFIKLKEILDLGLVDYVAMDIKGPIEKYDDICGVKVNKNNILKSIALIKERIFNYEFRTTTTKEQLNNVDFEQIKKLIVGSKRYILQKYIYRKNKLTNDIFTSFTDEEINKIRIKLEDSLQEVMIR